MSNNAVTPEKPIVIGGETYIMKGDMAALKNIQNHFDEDIYDLASRGLLSKRFDQLARIIGFGIGTSAPPLEVIEQDVVQVRGLDETKYLLMEWLVASVSPQRDREKNVAGLLEQIEKIKQATAAVSKLASRGKSTRNSA